MSEHILYILIGWAIAGGSPGPTTLAILSTSLSQGRRAGLILASGIVCGSATWGIAAALGLGGVMASNAWLFDVLRYVGASYLLWLAFKSARSAYWGTQITQQTRHIGHPFRTGFLIHITNPKAILAWGAIYTIAVPNGGTPLDIALVFALLSLTSICVFMGYAVLFSNAAIAHGYSKLKRLFDSAFAILFGYASLQILTRSLSVR